MMPPNGALCGLVPGIALDMSTTLQPGDMLPFGRLRPLDGGPLMSFGSNRSFAQVLIITHAEPCDDCSQYLHTFEEVAEALRNEKGEVVVLVGPDWDEAAISPSASALIGGSAI